MELEITLKTLTSKYDQLLLTNVREILLKIALFAYADYVIFKGSTSFFQLDAIQKKDTKQLTTTDQDLH